MIANDSLDERVAELMNRMSQGVSRRAILTKLGTWAFKIAGLSLAAVVLPVDRAFAQFGCAGDWQMCNMHGFFCKACCGHGARYNVCQPARTNAHTGLDAAAPTAATASRSGITTAAADRHNQTSAKAALAVSEHQDVPPIGPLTVIKGSCSIAR